MANHVTPFKRTPLSKWLEDLKKTSPTPHRLEKVTKFLFLTGCKQCSQTTLFFFPLLCQVQEEAWDYKKIFKSKNQILKWKLAISLLPGQFRKQMCLRERYILAELGGKSMGTKDKVQGPGLQLTLLCCLLQGQFFICDTIKTNKAKNHHMSFLKHADLHTDWMFWVGQSLWISLSGKSLKLRSFAGKEQDIRETPAISNLWL